MTWDLSADVVIVGFGAAGVAASLEAVASGATVLAVDRYSGGGAAAISGGIVYGGGGTEFQRAAGVEDTADDMFDYLSHEVGTAVTRGTLRKFCDESVHMIEWLTDHGVPFEGSLCPYKTSYPNNRYYLYYSGSEAAGESRKVARPAQRGHRAKGKGASGKKIYTPLAAAAKAKGVQLLRQTTASALITDGEGAVVGIECSTMRDAPEPIRRLHATLGALSSKPGVYEPRLRLVLEKRIARIERKYARSVRIQARSGVVLSAGGFVANREMMREHAPDYVGGIALGTAGDDGSGIKLGQSVGGATDRLGNVSAWRFISPPSAFLGSILVDSTGSRLVDESRYGAAIGDAMIKNSNGEGWLLADAELIAEAKKQIGDQSIWFQRVQNQGMVRTGVRGDSIADVARKVGIDPEGLQQSVDAYNDAAGKGDPDPMGKFADFVRPIRTAPFTLFDVSIKPSMMNPCPMLTLGGLVVDETTGSVESTTGEAISGLYAAGRTAVGICSDSYVSGLSLADCIFSGRRAGLHAAQRLKELATHVVD
ncbi:FAD-binding protein [Antrihabitans cavernicola]|uniref:FAD-binding protein n=1 Tax=Antrihabitans cavernicola TaxID=2495913 RepID=A0A5A7S9N8_9NOCA|nr:FAD-binding protein [Spelaeibacter cavernicola]